MRPHHDAGNDHRHQKSTWRARAHRSGFRRSYLAIALITLFLVAAAVLSPRTETIGTQKHAQRLYALVQSADGGMTATSAVMVDTYSGSLLPFKMGSTFCSAAYEPLSQHTLFSCDVGIAYRQFFSVNEETGAVEDGLSMGQAQSLRSPVVCEGATSPRKGVCYYSFGRGEYKEGRTVATATIIVANDGGRHAHRSLPVPDAEIGRIPTKLFIDNDRLLMLTASNPDIMDIVYRYDLSGERYLSPIELHMKAVDAAVIGDRIYVSGFTEHPFAARVSAFDLESGMHLWDSPSFADSTGVATDGKRLFAAGSVAMRELDLKTGTLVREKSFVQGHSFWSLAYGNAHLYAGGPTGWVYELDPDTFEELTSWEVGWLGTGGITIPSAM